MRILYIPSGYGKIYTSFNQSIEGAFQKLGMNMLTISATDRCFSEKLEAFQPDVALTMVGFQLPKEINELLRRKGIISAVWFTEDPYYIDQSIELIDRYDFIFTIDLAAIPVYKRAGHPHVYHLPLGTDPDIFFPIQVPEAYKSDICLIGYPYPNRVHLMNLLLKKTDDNIILVGSQWDKQIANQHCSNRLRIIPRWTSPTSVNLFFNGAKINVNTHRPTLYKKNKNKRKLQALSINNRTFDIAASNSFQLVDYKQDLYTHFNNEEMVHFENDEHFLELISYFLANKEERLAYATRSNTTVLKEHTFFHRMLKLIDIVNYPLQNN